MDGDWIALVASIMITMGGVVLVLGLYAAFTVDPTHYRWVAVGGLLGLGWFLVNTALAWLHYWVEEC